MSGVMSRLAYTRFGPGSGAGVGVAPDSGMVAGGSFGASAYGNSVSTSGTASATGILLLVLVGLVVLAGWKGL
jgi:hypothetical protein